MVGVNYFNKPAAVAVKTRAPLIYKAFYCDGIVIVRANYLPINNSRMPEGNIAYGHDGIPVNYFDKPGWQLQ